MSRAALLRLLEPHRLHLEVSPEEDDGFTLWLRELDLGENGRTLPAARAALIDAVERFVADYEARFDFSAISRIGAPRNRMCGG